MRLRFADVAGVFERALAVLVLRTSGSLVGFVVRFGLGRFGPEMSIEIGRFTLGDGVRLACIVRGAVRQRRAKPGLPSQGEVLLRSLVVLSRSLVALFVCHSEIPLSATSAAAARQ